MSPPNHGQTNPDVVDGKREALAVAMDLLAEAIGAAQDKLRSASPETRALIDNHESWAENFIWTDGSQVGKAARRIAALLWRSPSPTVPPTPTRHRPRGNRGN